MFLSAKFGAAIFILAFAANGFAADFPKGGADEIASGGNLKEHERPQARSLEKYGPTAAFDFARGYRGDSHTPGVLYCYPAAKGIPFDDTENIIAMNEKLWTPAELAADFDRRMATVPKAQRKKGIIVLSKTERCAPKAFRACTVTTAALEKRSTPLVGDFLIYGAWLKPRDDDNPPGSLQIETGEDVWKNQAAGEYDFHQGPGATLAFIDPVNARKISRTDALQLQLSEQDFVANQGHAPKLEEKLREVLKVLSPASGR